MILRTIHMLAVNPCLAAALFAITWPAFAQAAEQRLPPEVYIVCYYEESDQGPVHNSRIFKIRTEHFDAVQTSWMRHGSSQYSNGGGEVNGCVGRHTQAATEQAVESIRNAGVLGTTDRSWQPTSEFLVAAETQGLETTDESEDEGTLYGSLAIDSNQGSYFGWAVDFPTQSDADKHATNQCTIRGGTCAVVMRFSNACAAYVADQQTGSTVYGWAWHEKHRATAENMARSECVKRGGLRSRCITRVWGCTTRAGEMAARDDALLPIEQLEWASHEGPHAKPRVLDNSNVAPISTTVQAQPSTTHATPTEELMQAALSGSVDAMHKAIREGADVNAKRNDAEGATALMWAAFKGDQAMVSALLEVGANVNATDNQGENALDEARTRGHRNIVAILQSHRANTQQAQQRPAGTPEEGDGHFAELEVDKRQDTRNAALTAFADHPLAGNAEFMHGVKTAIEWLAEHDPNEDIIEGTGRNTAAIAQQARWGFCVSENIEWKKKRKATFGIAKRIDEFYTPIFAINDTVDFRSIDDIWERLCESELTWMKKSKRRSYTQDCECYWDRTRTTTVSERSKRIELAHTRLGRIPGFSYAVDWRPPREHLASEQDALEEFEQHPWIGRRELPAWVRRSDRSSSGSSDVWTAVGALTGTAILANKGVLDVGDAAAIASSIAQTQVARTPEQQDASLQAMDKALERQNRASTAFIGAMARGVPAEGTGTAGKAVDALGRILDDAGAGSTGGETTARDEALAALAANPFLAADAESTRVAVDVVNALAALDQNTTTGDVAANDSISGTLGVLSSAAIAAKDGALDLGDAMVVATTVAAGGGTDDAVGTLEGRLRSRTGAGGGGGASVQVAKGNADECIAFTTAADARAQLWVSQGRYRDDLIQKAIRTAVESKQIFAYNTCEYKVKMHWCARRGGRIGVYGDATQICGMTPTLSSCDLAEPGFWRNIVDSPQGRRLAREDVGPTSFCGGRFVMEEGNDIVWRACRDVDHLRGNSNNPPYSASCAWTR